MDPLKQVLSLQIFESLLKANIKSPKCIIRYPKTQLAQLTKLGPTDLEQVYKEAAGVILKDKCRPASLLQPWIKISTGCPVLDSLLKGGVSLKGITEIVGCSGVGKTQLCLQLALMTQLSKDFGGLGKCSVYICTEDVFPAKRLRELSREFSLKYQIDDCFEDNVFIDHAAEIGQLKHSIFTNLPQLLVGKNVGLVVIDSIAGVFRSENQKVDYNARSQDFISLSVKLNKLSEEYGFAVVCTNQVTDNIQTLTTEPCLGLAWSTLITTRLTVSRQFPSHVREIEVTFAPDLPNSSRRFVITKQGILGCPL